MLAADEVLVSVARSRSAATPRCSAPGASARPSAVRRGAAAPGREGRSDRV